MSTFGDGWVPIRRGIIEHVHDGRMTSQEHHVFISILLLADAGTAVWNGSAKALAVILRRSERAMTEALQGLESKGYILRDYVLGKQGGYPILLGEFELTRGTNVKKRIDLVATRVKYGIPDGLLVGQQRKLYRHAIFSACRTPVVRTGTSRREISSSHESATVSTDDSDSSSAKVGADFAEVSIRETRESKEGGGSGSPSPCPDDFLEAESPSLHSGDSKARPTPPLRPPPFFASGPTSEMESAEQLATMFFGFLGRLSKLDTASTFSSWQAGFERLISKHGLDTLGGAMSWAFEVDTFWPPLLSRAKEPLSYFEEKLETQILPRYNGWLASQRNAARKEQRKGIVNGQSQSRFSSVKKRGKQPLDNSAALAEAKRRLTEAYGTC